MGRRSGRAAARRAAAALESTPKKYRHLDDEEDEPMPDAEPEPEPEPEPAVEEPEEEAEKEESAAEVEEEEEEEEHQSAEEEEESAKSPSPPPVVMVRRKRLGRPPKNKPPDWDQMIEVPAREADLTPRRRGRGGWRGRGGRKGQQQNIAQHTIDKDGNTLDIVNDEVELPEDPEGETKVDKLGNLMGGREYRCRTFTVAGRGDRLYMLSTEPARCVGFRDSYLFFTKHRRLYKIIVDDEEKRDMIERDIIPHSYKGRSIGIVTARSVFREFGALIIVGGRRIIDDYDVAKAREEGVVEGELADPNDKYVGGEPYNKNQYVAWHGASAVYHSGGPAIAQQTGKLGDSKKRRVAVNDVNWQLEHAREASHFNTRLTAARKVNEQGIYDVHTNSVHYPANLQPTHARMVEVSPADEDAEPPSSVFPRLPPRVPRNFLVMDIHLETPPAGVAATAYERPSASSMGPGDRNRDRSDFLAPFRGLGAVSDDLRDLLPPECRAAFDRALNSEQKWLSSWGDEKDTMCRRPPVIDKAIVPFSMMQ